MSTRRYDLDWLRVIAFGLLIFYHIGMFYVTWGWHVKSPHAGPFAEPIMILMNPWRLPLLFFISGVALRFAVDKGESSFARRRFFRLFVPLMAGVFLVVPPQSYYELLANGEIGPGFYAFYARYVSFDGSFSIIVPTWNHLWYVAYMLVYTMLVLPLMPWLKAGADTLSAGGFDRLFGGVKLVLVPAGLFILYRFTTDLLFPLETHALVDDWGAHVRYVSYFLIGLLLAKNAAFWRAVELRRQTLIWTGFILAIAMSVIWANRGAVAENSFFALVGVAVRPFYAWVTILALLACAQKWLNRPSDLLRYMTTAIFAFYILHQTLIVVAGVWLGGIGLPVWAEFAALVTITFGGCALLYEFVIRRVRFLRPLFGVPT